MINFHPTWTGSPGLAGRASQTQASYSIRRTHILGLAAIGLVGAGLIVKSFILNGAIVSPLFLFSVGAALFPKSVVDFIFYVTNLKQNKTNSVQTNTPEWIPQKVRDTSERVNQAGQRAVKQIAESYQRYLNEPIEPVLNRMPEFPYSWRYRPLAERLVWLYTLCGYFRPANDDMRHGDVSGIHTKLVASTNTRCNFGAFGEPGNRDRKVYIAHLQAAINRSTHRISDSWAMNNTVYRVAYTTSRVMQYWLNNQRLGKETLFVNRSFLSTSSGYVGFDPNATCPVLENEQIEHQNSSTLYMQIRLLPTTPILDVNRCNSGIFAEREIILRAGGIFKVVWCYQETFYDTNRIHLRLEEISPDSMHSEPYADVL